MSEPLLKGVHTSPHTETQTTRPQTHISRSNAPSFAEMLQLRQGLAPQGAGKPTESLKFSAHAQSRLQSRQIALEPQQMERLEGAVQRAATKGSKDALVLMDELAMVVSVKNKTVVTVVDKENLKQNVFTNIDSAVIA